MMDRHVFLIGMPGCGKTSLGRRAARETGASFMDLDEWIGKAAGKTIPELFAEYGEAGFRRAETGALVWMTRCRPGVIATGGGAVMNPANRKIMRNWGMIVLLDRPLENILEDIRTEDRPLLQGEDGGEKLRALYEERDPVYRAAADVIIRNDRGFEEGLAALTRLIRERNSR